MGEEKPVNVLYLSYDGMTDPLGESQVIPYLHGLSKTYTFWLISFEKPDRFQKDGLRIQNLLEKLGIQWHPYVYHKAPPVLSTIYDLAVMFRESNKLINKYQIKLVHCRSYPSGLIGLRLKRKYGVKFLFDIRGFWANERVDGGIWNLKNPLFRRIYAYFKRKEAEMMGEADHIISLTYAGKAEIVSGGLFEYPHQAIKEDNVTVIPCAVDLELFDPKKVSDTQRRELKSKLGVADADKILCYLGSVGTWYMLEEMLLFYKHWVQGHPEYKFLFVTPDSPSVIFTSAAEIGLDKSNLIVRKASRLEVPDYLSMVDLGIFFIKPAYSKKASSATKMGELIAMGVPFITNKGVGDGDYLLETFKIGYLTDPMGYEGIDIDLNRQLGDYSGAVAYFSLNSGVEKYLKVYKDLLKIDLVGAEGT